jgi:hypothetical protein
MHFLYAHRNEGNYFLATLNMVHLACRVGIFPANLDWLLEPFDDDQGVVTVWSCLSNEEMYLTIHTYLFDLVHFTKANPHKFLLRVKITEAPSEYSGCCERVSGPAASFHGARDRLEELLNVGFQPPLSWKITANGVYEIDPRTTARYLDSIPRLPLTLPERVAEDQTLTPEPRKSKDTMVLSSHRTSKAVVYGRDLAFSKKHSSPWSKSDASTSENPFESIVAGANNLWQSKFRSPHQSASDSFSDDHGRSSQSSFDSPSKYGRTNAYSESSPVASSSRNPGHSGSASMLQPDYSQYSNESREPHSPNAPLPFKPVSSFSQASTSTHNWSQNRPGKFRCSQL